MQTIPMLSIIVPVYKVEKFLPRCIDKILGQEYADFEVILVDDGSPDSSGEICDEYALTDSRIKVCHIENGGLPNARNVGIRHARGKYYMFIDSDDFYVDRIVFGTVIKEMEEYDLDMLQFSYDRVYENGRWKNDLESAKYSTPVMDGMSYYKTGMYQVSAWSCVVRAGLLSENDVWFDKTLRMAEDQIFIFEVLGVCKRVKRINNVLYHYAFNPGSMSLICNSEQLIGPVYAFIDIMQRFPQFKKHADLFVYQNILNFARDRHVPLSVIRDIYDKADLKWRYDNAKTKVIFNMLCRIDLLLGVWFLRYLVVPVNKLLR